MDNHIENMKVIIIAEVGECFNGSLRRAEFLIKESKEAGCDYVKFQTLDYENISEDDPEKEWFRRIALDPRKIRRLISFADKYGIRIMFTPENVKTAQWLAQAGLKDIKIASSIMTDADLLRFVNDNFKRVFLSTGMASLKEVKDAVRKLKRISDLYILHCISEYPTGPLLKARGLKALESDEVRFNMMEMLMRIFPEYKIGYSDHTAGILAPIVAVAMGARVIEKHFTADRKTPIENFKKGKTYLGTDHVLSLEPKELRQMVSQIRETEKMFGNNKWERSRGEKVLKAFLRRRFFGRKN